MQSNRETKENDKDHRYQAAVIVVGLLSLLIAAGNTIANYQWRELLVLLAVMPLIVIVDLFPLTFYLFGGRKTEKENLTFTLIDAFVLVIASWFGMAPAVLIAGIEGFISSRRQVRRLSSNLFSLSMMALTAAAASFTISALLHDGWSGAAIARHHSISALAAAMFGASIVQIAVNWSLLSTLLALRHENSLARLWKHFLSTAPMSLPTSVAASLIYFAVQNGTIAMMAIGGPVLLAIYFGHHQNRVRSEQAERLERERAEDAERHVEELSRYIAEQQRILEKFTQIEKLSALGELSSGVAHDFNNTLAGILGRAQLLQAHSKDPAEIQRGLDIIIKTAKDGAKTVKRIQDFARQHRDNDYEPVAVEQLLSDVSEITRPRWKNRAETANIYINLRLDIATDAFVLGEASELREVMVNMVFNAVDAMPNGGTITLSAEEVEGQVAIRIADTGAGMTEEVRSRIFDPFFTTKGKSGMGLGLAVSYGIICRHEGTVEVESAVGRGTTFTIKLPVTGKTATTEELDGGPKPKQSQAKLRILVADDESFIRELLRDILESEGHTVLEAEDGFKALELFQAGTFDAIFTDIGMPGMSGWELTKTIRQKNKQIPLAILTGWGEGVSSNDQKTAEVNWVVAKPFSLERIAEILSEITRQSTAPNEAQRRQLTLVA